MKRNLCACACAGLILAAAAALTGCSTAPESEADRAIMRSEVEATLERARAADPSLGSLLDSSPGYAVFPTVGKGAVGVGGAYGRGVLYQGGQPVGYCDLTQGSIGLQLGGQSYSEIIVFEANRDVERFKTGNIRFAAQATAVGLTSGAGANAKYAGGVAVFTFGEAGLMYEASIGGQQFTYEPM